MRRVLQFYKLRRVCCFVEGRRGQFLTSANVKSCNGKVPYVVAGDCRAMATVIVIRGQCGTGVRMAKGSTKRRNQNGKGRKQRSDSPALHTKSTSQRTPRHVRSQIVRGSRLRARSTSRMRLILGEDDFAAERAVDVDEVCGGKQNPEAPPGEANFQPIVCGFGAGNGKRIHRVTRGQH
jgi:hypothetical protein